MKNKKKRIKVKDDLVRALHSKNPRRKSMALEKAQRKGNFKPKKKWKIKPWLRTCLT